MRHVLRETVLPDGVERVWDLMQTSHSMIFVSAPLLAFRPTKPATFPQTWKQGQTYLMDMLLFGFIPVGWHSITVVRVDAHAKEIENHDGGSGIKSWKHVLSVKPIDENHAMYCDSLEIDAGWQTPFLAVFLNLYYWNRQRRWAKLLAK